MFAIWDTSSLKSPIMHIDAVLNCAIVFNICAVKSATGVVGEQYTVRITSSKG